MYGAQGREFSLPYTGITALLIPHGARPFLFPSRPRELSGLKLPFSHHYSNFSTENPPKTNKQTPPHLDLVPLFMQPTYLHADLIMRCFIFMRSETLGPKLAGTNGMLIEELHQNDAFNVFLQCRSV